MQLIVKLNVQQQMLNLIVVNYGAVLPSCDPEDGLNNKLQ